MPATTSLSVGGMTPNGVTRVAQEGGAAGLAGEAAGLALGAQVVRGAGEGGDVAHQGLRLVDIQVVDAEVPAAGLGIGGDGLPDVATKSASVRVGPCEGASAWPLTTSRLRMKVVVLWRIYSNSRRSTRPGASGKPGFLRSRAGPPVSSSVLTTRSPAAAKAGAAW
jgi:hypothetical protein